ncbi:hypothetical protein PZ897_19270 [Hoeflea sp. YIM 152468]|uniref:hypothetical protein n=1 Tax=Hoeflea sp. YIM 152468 TaxID=3031759 RepID=UPI0023D9FBDC|nr:hypothetical protein [Hoeflea sp. YIM 152468]MDF1610327.1 hypothetical protein [Hoeflea sp. YIM 152468]
MTLGNPVRFSGESDRPVIMIPVKIDLRDNQAFWRRKVFSIPKTGFFGWLFNRRNKRSRDFPWIVGGNPHPNGRADIFRVSRGSVDEVLYTLTNQLVIGTANGSEVVEVAFQHLTFISGPGGVCDTASERGLEERISESLSSTLKGYFDPTIGVRVDCMVNPALPANQLNMYLGQGIFVPRRGERPIGWIRYYPDHSRRDHYTEPQLLDGRPAGLYKGQGGLVIGIGEGLLHAEIDLGSGEEVQSSYLFINKDAVLAPTGNDDRNQGVDARLSFCHGHGNEPVPSRVASVDDQCDIAWKIDFVATAQAPGRLELCVDSRRSRLHWKPSGRCNAAINSLLFDLRDFSQRDVERLWVDLDRDNVLTAYALQVARVSLVWDCENEEQYVYEWGQTGAPFKTLGSVGLKCRTIEAGIIEVGRADGEPFGYLELPDSPEKAIFSDAFQSFGGYHLDWLDQCGRISFGDTVLSLGEAYAEKCSGMPVSAFEPGETRKIIGPLVLTPYREGSDP